MVTEREWTITPPDERMYCYCPTCRFVATVLSEGPGDLPWCTHHERYVWRSGSVESGWTPMLPVTVIAALSEERP